LENQISQFIEYLASQKNYAGNTLMAYRNDLLQFHQFVMTTRPYLSSWARVDSLLMQAYLLDLKARSYSSSSIARKVAALKSFYFYLTEMRVMASNPTLDLDAPRVSKPAPLTLTQEQVIALLHAPAEPNAKGLRDRALLEVMYATGIRVSELVTLEVRDVAPDAGTLRIGTGPRERVVALNPDAQSALREYMHRARAGFGASPESGPLFVNPRGDRLTRQGVWLILKQYVKQVGIESGVTPHSLRHSFAAHRLAGGSSLQEVQRMLGHAHSSTTQAYRPPALTDGLSHSNPERLVRPHDESAE
jgi:integrase/recombinase XerD